MHCAAFMVQLDAFMAGELVVDARAEMQNHASQCERCAGVLEAMHAPGSESKTDADTEAFVASLLQRTTGSTCVRAQSQLPDHVDGALLRDDAALVDVHLRHCQSCAALAVVLGALRRDLPALALADPGAEFTLAVLAATRTRPRASHALGERLASTWRHLAARPRLAWEFATAACFLLMLLCGLPFSPLRPLPQHALAVIQLGGGIPAAVQRFEPVMDNWTSSLWAGTGGRIQNAAAARQQEFLRAHPTAAGNWEAVRADLTEARAGIRSGNLAQLSHALQALRVTLDTAFASDRQATPNPEPR